MPPNNTRKQAAPTGRPSRNNISATHSNGHRPQDGYTAPSAADRHEQAVLAEAHALGYRLAVQCLDCGHWLANPISVAALRGPRCRAKAAA